jgi:hypothetical protein
VIGMVARTVLAVAAAACLAAAARAQEAPRALTIEARSQPFSTGEDAKSATGKLVHRGSLRLTSDDEDFGGISGLIVSEDGARLLAITDASHWLTAELVYRDGKLVGARGVEMAPLLATDGSALNGKDGDAEGLAGSLDGDVFVSFEREHRIWRYAFGKDGLRAKPTKVATPAELAQAPDNGGLEALARLADGRLLAMTEAFHDSAGNIRGWIIGDGGDEPLALKRRAPFDLTDVRQLVNGDLLTLERRFSRVGGVGFMMRRVPAGTIARDALLDGEVVADVGMNFIIDNMEGLSVRKTGDGKTLVYAISDDNFNAPLQQTLLMMFELRD